ncbi:MAG TPA: hypothetical protein PK867_02090 [Pirellulales bacterium]|nr:hypothetical protein [Pirellulales bacterium]
MNDPIVDEIRKIRDAHAARFNYDLDAICRDIKEREKEWEKKLGRKFVSYAAGPVEPAPTPAAAPVSANASLPEASPAAGH